MDDIRLVFASAAVVRRTVLRCGCCVVLGSSENSPDIVSYKTEVNNTLGRNRVAIFLEQGVNGCAFSSASAVQLYLRARVADLEVQLLVNTSAFEVGTQGGASEAIGRWLRVLPYFVGPTQDKFKLKTHRSEFEFELDGAAPANMTKAASASRCASFVGVQLEACGDELTDHFCQVRP
ncbi:hypothetical protein B0H14DRAFT_2555268 [Mycena olivaceomarginata]|nr:hypothetical protein B0H14DRAFT_2555268 [Mycena olivaceomarginata]